MVPYPVLLLIGACLAASLGLGFVLGRQWARPHLEPGREIAPSDSSPRVLPLTPSANLAAVPLPASDDDRELDPSGLGATISRFCEQIESECHQLEQTIAEWRGEPDEGLEQRCETLLRAAQAILRPTQDVSDRVLEACDRLIARTQTADETCLLRTDALTGLSSSYALEELSRMLFGLLSRYGHTFSMAMVEPELPVGAAMTAEELAAVRDQKLCALAKFLESNVRDSDHVFRWHGHQLAVVLPETDLEGAENFCRRIQNRVWLQLQLPICLGVSTARDDDNLRSLTERLTVAVYAAQSDGCNTIYAHDGHQIEAVKTDLGQLARPVGAVQSPFQRDEIPLASSLS